MLLKDRLSEFRNHFLKRLIFSPYQCLIVLLILISVSIVGISKLESDFHYEIWFQENDPGLQTFKEFQRTFGNDETLIFSIYNADGIVTPNAIPIIKELTEELWGLKGTIDVDSISNYNHAFVLPEDEISIGPFFASSNLNQTQWLKRLDIIEEVPVFYNYYINHAKTIALIYARQKPYIDERPDEMAIVQQARDIIKLYQKKYPDYDFKVAGGLTVGNSYREIAEHDLITILPLMFVIIGGILFLFFRSSMGLFIPFIITFLSCLFTFAIAGFLQIKFNNILGLIPQALMAISIADSIHILVSYYQQKSQNQDSQKLQKSKDALFIALKKNTFPTLLTTLSTAMGFISFSTAFMKPLIHFGMLSALGTLFAWISTFMVFIVWVNFLERDDHIKRSFNFLPMNTTSLFKMSEGKRKFILSSFLFFTLIGTYIGLQNEINTNPINYFRSDVPAKIANDFILDKLGAMPGPEFVIKAPQTKSAFEPVFLKKVDSFINKLKDKEEIIQVNSIIPIIKQLNRTLHNDKASSYKIPDQQDSIAQLILLYQMGLTQGKSINDKLSLDNTKLKLSLLWTLQNSKESIELLSKIEELAKESDLDLTITGKNPLFLGLNEKVSKSLLYSLALALILISILLALVFKSVKLFAISLICNLSPLMIGAAVMTLFNIPLSISSAMVFSVCLGIVVDDTIHFLMKYIQLDRNRNSHDNHQILQQVLKESGSSIFVTSAILVIGFGLFIFAQFMLNVHFGLIAAIILASAAIIDLYILPLLLKQESK